MIRPAVAVGAFTSYTAHPAITVSSRHRGNARYVVSVSPCHLTTVVCYAVVIATALYKNLANVVYHHQDEQSQANYRSLEDDVLQGVLLHSSMTFRTNEP